MKKIEKARRLFQEQEGMFICPVCRREMEMTVENSFLCTQGHRFDLAKKGYAHLLRRASSTNYTTDLFQARRRIFSLGFFDKVNEQIVEVLQSYGEKKNWCTPNFLDIGCGEGFHLARLMQTLREKNWKKTLGIGVDLEKPGIQMAARDYTDDLWIVANLDDLPLADGAFDVILNIFSPVNASEFRRVLNDDGIVVKVIPGPDYLQELRVALYKNRRGPLETSDVLSNFQKRFDVLEVRRVRERVQIDRESLPALMAMTPLSWDAAKVQREAFFKLDSLHVTVDVTLLVGKI